MISLRPRSEHRADLDLTPFMDVIFILLIFFIIASAFAVRGLDIDLPSAQSSQALSGRVVEVRLEENGSYLCDGVPVEREFLRYKLQEIVRGFKKEPGQLVLKADPKAPVDALIFVVDEVRMLGGEKLMVATSRPEERRK
ncbi:MAG: biopolymer transporter ExbD [Mailhella sp.]|jgi:biopolymer transport protein ExbD|nr:biopolymer transporter ExbD [Mailhella sp.]